MPNLNPENCYFLAPRPPAPDYAVVPDNYLVELANMMGENEPQKREFERQFIRHIRGDFSTKRIDCQQIESFLKQIYLCLKNHDLSQNLRSSIISSATYSDAIQNCSKGYHIRLTQIIQGLNFPTDLKALVSLYRHDIAEPVCVKHGQDVHSYQKCFEIAKDNGYGIEPPNENDVYSYVYDRAGVENAFKNAFDTKYTFFNIVNDVSQRIKDRLAHYGYVGCKGDNESYTQGETRAIYQFIKQYLPALPELSGDDDYKLEEIFIVEQGLVKDVNFDKLNLKLLNAVKDLNYFNFNPAEIAAYNYIENGLTAKLEFDLRAKLEQDIVKAQNDVTVLEADIDSADGPLKIALEQNLPVYLQEITRLQAELQARLDIESKVSLQTKIFNSNNIPAGFYNLFANLNELLNFLNTNVCNSSEQKLEFIQKHPRFNDFSSAELLDVIRLLEAEQIHELFEKYSPNNLKLKLSNSKLISALIAKSTDQQVKALLQRLGREHFVGLTFDNVGISSILSAMSVDSINYFDQFCGPQFLKDLINTEQGVAALLKQLSPDKVTCVLQLIGTNKINCRVRENNHVKVLAAELSSAQLEAFFNFVGVARQRLLIQNRSDLYTNYLRYDVSNKVKAIYSIIMSLNVDYLAELIDKDKRLNKVLYKFSPTQRKEFFVRFGYQKLANILECGDYFTAALDKFDIEQGRLFLDALSDRQLKRYMGGFLNINYVMKNVSRDKLILIINRLEQSHLHNLITDSDHLITLFEYAGGANTELVVNKLGENFVKAILDGDAIDGLTEGKFNKLLNALSGDYKLKFISEIVGIDKMKTRLKSGNIEALLLGLTEQQKNRVLFDDLGFSLIRNLIDTIDDLKVVLQNLKPEQAEQLINEIDPMLFARNGGLVLLIDEFREQDIKVIVDRYGYHIIGHLKDTSARALPGIGEEYNYLDSEFKALIRRYNINDAKFKLFINAFTDRQLEELVNCDRALRDVLKLIDFNQDKIDFIDRFSEQVIGEKILQNKASFLNLLQNADPSVAMHLISKLSQEKMREYSNSQMELSKILDKAGFENTEAVISILGDDHIKTVMGLVRPQGILADLGLNRARECNPNQWAEFIETLAGDYKWNFINDVLGFENIKSKITADTLDKWLAELSDDHKDQLIDKLGIDSLRFMINTVTDLQEILPVLTAAKQQELIDGIDFTRIVQNPRDLGNALQLLTRQQQQDLLQNINFAQIVNSIDEIQSLRLHLPRELYSRILTENIGNNRLIALMPSYNELGRIFDLFNGDDNAKDIFISSIGCYKWRAWITDDQSLIFVLNILSNSQINQMTTNIGDDYLVRLLNRDRGRNLYYIENKYTRSNLSAFMNSYDCSTPKRVALLSALSNAGLRRVITSKDSLIGVLRAVNTSGYTITLLDRLGPTALGTIISDKQSLRQVLFNLRTKQQKEHLIRNLPADVLKKTVGSIADLRSLQRDYNDNSSIIMEKFDAEFLVKIIKKSKYERRLELESLFSVVKDNNKKLAIIQEASNQDLLKDIFYYRYSLSNFINNLNAEQTNLVLQGAGKKQLVELYNNPKDIEYFLGELKRKAGSSGSYKYDSAELSGAIKIHKLHLAKVGGICIAVGVVSMAAIGVAVALVFIPGLGIMTLGIVGISVGAIAAVTSVATLSVGCRKLHARQTLCKLEKEVCAVPKVKSGR